MDLILLGEWFDDLAKNEDTGRERKLSTRRKAVEVVQLAWQWAWDEDEYGEYVPRPRTIKMPTQPNDPVVAPTWAEMDACVDAAEGHLRQLALMLRFTGLRVQQVMGLLWDDVDLKKGVLRIRGELGKTRSERQGRLIPVSRHLIEIMATWGRREGWIVPSKRKKGGERERVARSREMVAAWKRADVSPDIWRGRPHHAFRKGFSSGLKRVGADDEAVEFLLGHSLGLRGVYNDPNALPLREAVDMIPALGVGPEVSVSH